MAEIAAAYEGCRERIGSLVSELDAQRAATPVPACPDWSVHDVVAHLVGVVDDVLAGRLDGVATEPWTAAQVDSRRDRSISELVSEWSALAAGFSSLIDTIGDPMR